MLQHVFILMIVSFSNGLNAQEDEPFCLSRYDYDYKLMKKIVTMELENKDMKKLLDKQSDLIKDMGDIIGNLRTDNEENFKILEQKVRDVTIVSGSTYIRWGRAECPKNGTDTIYSGYAGGSHYTHTGAAADYLCLPPDPVWDEYDDKEQGYGRVYGAEYELPSKQDNTLFKKSLYENDVPCAVCRSSRASAVMIPARNTCYGGWTVEYTGYLMSGYHGHKAASNYACMDVDPEVIPGGHVSVDGKLFYLVEAHCGSLRCPPYVHGRELTCVVCTK